ncbi:hypothetical protein HDU92_007779 [Lobulomyces angularis]|nr:hypothetical protein HDU92_007779 [Lobulomyces angularis]
MLIQDILTSSSSVMNSNINCVDQLDKSFVVTSSQDLEVLYNLALYYLQQIKYYLSDKEKTQNLIRVAFASLELILAKGNSLILNSKLQLKTRLTLLNALLQYSNNEMQIESILQKSLFLCQQTNDLELLDYQFSFKDFQAQLFFKRSNTLKLAKNIFKQCEIDASKLGLPKWIYHFQLRRVLISLMENDMLATNFLLKKFCENAQHRNDFEIMFVFLLSRMNLTLITNDHQQSFEINEKMKLLIQEKKIHNKYLELFQSLLEVTLYIKTGKFFALTKLLKKLHEQVEVKGFMKTNDVINFKNGILNLKIVKNDNPVVLSMQNNMLNQSQIADTEKNNIDTHNTNNSAILNSDISNFEYLEIKVFTSQKLFALIYLLSGISFKPGDTVKAHKYLSEGLKFVEKNLTSLEGETVEDILESRYWHLDIKALILRQLAEVFLLRCEYKNAGMALKELLNFLTVETPLWEKHEKFVSLLLGFYYQSLGKFEDSKNWLKKTIELASSLSPKIANNNAQTNLNNFSRQTVNIHPFHLNYTPNDSHQVNFELMLFSKLSLLLIYLKYENEEEKKEAENLLQNIKAHLSSNSTALIDNQMAFLHTAEGLKCSLECEITQTKGHLLKTLKLGESLFSSQLKYFSLAILGNFFLNTNSEQAEKMLQTAFQHSKKIGNKNFSFYLCLLLKKFYEMNSGLEDSKGKILMYENYLNGFFMNEEEEKDYLEGYFSEIY